ncbi:hypothetical protein FXN63_03890 [Pigmentiphaga aceris]|uniref:Preprotein translocase subunit YajC n=1 Tax=Pigmentiphaga aceris TaxID=1940612 RepID=A0A5C0AS77_9BURK|nr:PP0621 family protein [Pigmentiphaga aceris]QEI05072.1 hypothetical protein FXN63_03890 [Pigmentiphaga aceris]
MGKLLFWIIVIIGVLFALRMLARHAGKPKSKPVPPTAPPASGRKSDAVPHMARCAHCGIHLPRAEALLLKGNTWCSEEHAQLGARQLD